MDKVIQRLKERVMKNYDQPATGYSWQRSEGNCADCFYDGQANGTSWAAYEVGDILGMDLPEPELEEECDD